MVVFYSHHYPNPVNKLLNADLHFPDWVHQCEYRKNLYIFFTAILVSDKSLEKDSTSVNGKICLFIYAIEYDVYSGNEAKSSINRSVTTTEQT